MVHGLGLVDFRLPVFVGRGALLPAASDEPQNWGHMPCVLLNTSKVYKVCTPICCRLPTLTL